jgi:hypothetical protein
MSTAPLWGGSITLREEGKFDAFDFFADPGRDLSRYLMVPTVFKDRRAGPINSCAKFVSLAGNG